jgi:transcriptional regulator with XRE-family HTH domain
MSTYELTISNNLLIIVNEMDYFRKYIAKRQAELSLSGNELARRTGKTGAWLSRFMSGDREVLRVDTLIALAKALNISPEKLLLAYEGKDPDKKITPEDDKALSDAIQDFLKKIPREEFIKAFASDQEAKVVLKEFKNKLKK